MEISAALESEDGIFVHSEVTAEIRCAYREAFAVSLGVRIAAFDDQTEGAKNRVGGLEFVSELFQAQQRLHTRDQFFGENRLVQEIVGSRFDAAHFIAAITK